MKNQILLPLTLRWLAALLKRLIAFGWSAQATAATFTDRV